MKRLDQLMVELALSDSRNRAQRLIKSGLVTVTIDSKESIVTKPSVKFPDHATISVTDSPEDRYVSRAGLKLEGAISALDYSFDGHCVLDVGCSTGGFTDCALKHGAQTVVGIDVGHDQFHPSLLTDPRVSLYEGVNARDLPTQTLLKHAPNGFDTIVMDVSFISQTLILPELPQVLAKEGCLISLVKPQFELQPKDIGRGGIVKDKALFEQVQQKIIQCCDEHQLKVVKYLPSPITGTDGNHEFLALIKRA